MKLDKITYRILDSYRNKELDNVNTGIGVTGLIALVAGVVFDSTPLSIGGASLVGIATAEGGIAYMKAYFEARLDYLQNNRFTKV